MLTFLLKVLVLSLGLAVAIKAVAPVMSELCLSLPTPKLNVLALMAISLPVIALAVLLQIRVLQKLQ